MALSPTKLKELYIKNFNLDEVEQAIDEQLVKNHTQHPWEEVLLDEEYSVEVRDALAKRYINAGWDFVYHQTSSENKERPGLTMFAFSNVPVNYYENELYHKITRMPNENN